MSRKSAMGMLESTPTWMLRYRFPCRQLQAAPGYLLLVAIELTCAATASILTQRAMTTVLRGLRMTRSTGIPVLSDDHLNGAYDFRKAPLFRFSLVLDTAQPIFPCLPVVRCWAQAETRVLNRTGVISCTSKIRLEPTEATVRPAICRLG